MLKYSAIVSVLAIFFALLLPGNPVAPVGLYQVDNRHSDAQLITDATTNYGKTKIDFAVGVARVTGKVNFNNENPAQSAFDITMYPSTSTTPVIGEDGKLKVQWFSNLANHTLICFHSRGVSATPEGRLRTSGTLVLTRVDRNVEFNPSEAYSGPTYGPPMIHRLTHDATFVFDSPKVYDANAKADPKDTQFLTSGSTKLVKEDFPQLFKSVMATYWPPVVQDEDCKMPANTGAEDFSGPRCTGTFIDSPGLPQEPQAAPPGEDFPATNAGFNSVEGNRLTISVHLRLLPPASNMRAVTGK